MGLKGKLHKVSSDGLDKTVTETTTALRSPKYLHDYLSK